VGFVEPNGVATGHLDALPERLAGLAVNVRFGERKFAQFNIIEH
jgi:hypothetical protein